MAAWKVLSTVEGREMIADNCKPRIGLETVLEDMNFFLDVVPTRFEEKCTLTAVELWDKEEFMEALDQPKEYPWTVE